ncbi:MAG: OmpH family outer membrane protein [Victivallales bacterium]|jgi:outer membrane protein
MKKTTFSAIIVSLAIALNGFCADQKVALVDMEKLFQNYYKTKISDADLKKQAEIFKDYSNKLNDSLLKLQDEFKEVRDASQNIALSEAERENKRISAQDKYRQLKEKENEVKQYNAEKQNQLKDKYEELRNSLLKEISETIRKYCQSQGITLVLDSSGKTLNNIPSVIYRVPELDITDVILKEINKAVEDKKAPEEKKTTVDKKEEKKSDKK